MITEQNPGEAVLTATLQTGSYVAFVESFQLTKDDGTGHFVPVKATSENNDIQFSVENGTTTTITLRFQTDGTIVTVGSGQLDVGVAVDQVPPACAAFGSDCPPGLWCPPTGLTSQPAACVAAGQVPVGGACASPSDCVANASCFDSGSGPRCSALCPPASFGAPCDTGGTCMAAGKDYGICTDADAGSNGGSPFSSCVGTAPTSATALGGVGSPGGGVYTYAATGLAAPSAIEIPLAGDTGIQVTANPGVPTDPANAFSGFGVFFSSPACVDASAFTGVQFTVTGDLGTCVLQFSATPSDDSATSSNPLSGRCTAPACLAPSSVPLGTGTTTVHFTDLANGTPDPTENTAAIVGLNWNLQAPTDGESAPCSANFTVGGIKFITN
jgi:hypothetical protein